MSPAAEYLYEQALRLSEVERASLAARLMESLEPSSDDDAAAAWGAELPRRMDELDSGAVQAIPWDEARRIIRETHNP